METAQFLRIAIPLVVALRLAGTLAYMAPEQTGRMNRSVDSRSDLYALGVAFYELLTGGLPFTGSDPIELIHRYQHELRPAMSYDTVKASSRVAISRSRP
jgi:serine/threonine protein kinase